MFAITALASNATCSDSHVITAYPWLTSCCAHIGSLASSQDSKIQLLHVESEKLKELTNMYSQQLANAEQRALDATNKVAELERSVENLNTRYLIYALRVL